MITIDEASEYHTVKSAAKALNKHERTILRWCRNGTINAIKLGGAWMIIKPIQIKNNTP